VQLSYEMEVFMNRVYWIKGRSPNLYKSITSRIEALFGMEEMADVVVHDRSLALKVNLSEPGYAHPLPPIVVNTFFQLARAKGAKAVVTDSGSLFKGPRFDGSDWMNAAILQGFGIGEALQNQMMLAGGYTNEEGRFCPSDGEHLGGIELGSLITDISNLIVISHVTAHPLTGLAGALYNLGSGLLTRTGKSRIHDCLDIEFDELKCNGCKACLTYCPTGALSDAGEKVAFDSRICNGCLGCFMICPQRAMSVKPEGVITFQESIAEAAQVVAQNLRGKAFYVNFLTSVTPQSEEYPFSDIPFIPDLGILASVDPVALDWVTYQMILRGPGVPGSIAEDLNVLEKGADKLKAITGCTPVRMIEYAEHAKLGSRDCEFLVGEQ
jgi:uncharacterized Fe-S center protein